MDIETVAFHFLIISIKEVLSKKGSRCSMAPILYMLAPSPAVRSVLMCAKALRVDLEYKTVNLMNGEHLTPEYLKINPQHTVPTLDDDGFIIWDSHVIMGYLVGKYGDSKSLYPEDLEKRAVIDQRLHFDSNFLFPRGAELTKLILYGGATEVPDELREQMLEAYDFLEIFLENQDFLAGNELSIADFSIVTSLNSFSAYVPIDESKYSRIAAWMTRMEELPYYEEANQPGLDIYRGMVAAKLAQ